MALNEVRLNWWAQAMGKCSFAFRYALKLSPPGVAPKSAVLPTNIGKRKITAGVNQTPFLFPVYLASQKKDLLALLDQAAENLSLHPMCVELRQEIQQTKARLADLRFLRQRCN
jgi:hypothetical protein